MTNAPTIAAGSAQSPRPTSSAPAAVAAIDPVKLLNKYKWALLASAVAGAVIGIMAHFVLLKVYPVWKPTALLRCFPPRTSAEMTSAASNPSMEEMRQFMATESKIMTGEGVLDRLSANPQLQSQASKWAAQFVRTTSDGARNFDRLEALEDLKDIVHARVVPQSSLIELSVSWRDKADATTILQMLTETYIQVVTDQSKAMSGESVDALKGTISRLDSEINILVSKRTQLMNDSSDKGSITSRQETERARLMLLETDRIDKANIATALQEEIAGMRERANSAEGDKYTDEMRAEASRDPQVLDARSGLQSVERAKKALESQGYDHTHRLIQQYNSQLEASRATVDAAMREALDKTFRARLDGLSTSLRSTNEQIAQLEAKIAEVNKTIIGARATENEIEDLTQRIQLSEARRSEANGQLLSIQTLITIESSRRVMVQQRAQTPNLLSFPKIEIMVLAGMVLTVLITGGTFFVRELVDQRVKSPADIGIIPRTRLLGWIPDAAEDPESGGATETAFRDRAKGVVAESFRQIREVLLKRVSQAGHKTIVVVGGLPGSGATSVASNLALAAAASERRVLLIDANMRRPTVNKVFGLGETPGLADILAKQAELADAIQATKTPNLDVMPAGAKDLRVVERLSTEAMSELLAQVRATYDLVLIDVAPAVVAGDGVALASRCDASILVVRAFGEKRGMVARIKNELSDTRGEFLGVIVNAVRASAGGYLKGNIKVAAEYQKA